MDELKYEINDTRTWQEALQDDRLSWRTQIAFSYIVTHGTNIAMTVYRERGTKETWGE